MKEQAIKSRLLGLVRENGLLDGEQIDELWDVNLFEQGIIDSMGSVYWIALLNDEFGIELDPTLLLTELNTLEAITQHLAKKVA
jgi:acyl carrier protein